MGGASKNKARRRSTLAPRKRRRKQRRAGPQDGSDDDGEEEEEEGGRNSGGRSSGSESEYLPSDADPSKADLGDGGNDEKGTRHRRRRRSDDVDLSDVDNDDDGEREEEDAAGEFDDECDDYFEQRLARSWAASKRSRLATGVTADEAIEVEYPENDDGLEEEEGGSVAFDGGFKVPSRVFGRLFPYQQTAVKWLWELHTQRVGGILGDEMVGGKSLSR